MCEWVEDEGRRQRLENGNSLSPCSARLAVVAGAALPLLLSVLVRDGVVPVELAGRTARPTCAVVPVSADVCSRCSVPRSLRERVKSMIVGGSGRTGKGMLGAGRAGRPTVPVLKARWCARMPEPRTCGYVALKLESVETGYEYIGLDVVAVCALDAREWREWRYVLVGVCARLALRLGPRLCVPPAPSHSISPRATACACAWAGAWAAWN